MLWFPANNTDSLLCYGSLVVCYAFSLLINLGFVKIFRVLLLILIHSVSCYRADTLVPCLGYHVHS